MRLAPLLAALSDDQLGRLSVEHIRGNERPARTQVCNVLESSLRSYRFVHDFVMNRQPPAFAYLTLLLDAPGYELPLSGFHEHVLEETLRLADLVASGELLARAQQLQVYRKALYEARRSDLDLNDSEAGILSVLRRELRITQVEHFLLEHHPDFWPFWRREHCVSHEDNALRSAGLVFEYGDTVLIPEEIAPAVRQAFGIDMAVASARRLLSYLSSNDLKASLEWVGARTTGTKEERLERVLLARIQPRDILNSASLSTLRDICRGTGAAVSGNKEDLVERVVAHFAQGKDQRVSEPEEPPRREERRLDRERFEALFSVLLHQELNDILRSFPDLRLTGTKEVRIATLWAAHLSEETLLSQLMNRDLEDVLHRLGLTLGGSKAARIVRIVDYFVAPPTSVRPADRVTTVREERGVVGSEPSEVLAAQALFRQNAASPQTRLQPWLEELLDAPGAVRCYATEDANPTKQLKNKLAQAAAARGGILLLMLADSSAFEKARQALVERWMANDEWSKDVACVALAYPLGQPIVQAIVEHTASPWPSRLVERVFPTAPRYKVGSEWSCTGPTLRTCSKCGAQLATAARFCSQCGAPVRK